MQPKHHEGADKHKNLISLCPSCSSW
ncbi:MAG: HNH endonuclease [Syntrophobacteria bacterium]